MDLYAEQIAGIYMNKKYCHKCGKELTELYTWYCVFCAVNLIVKLNGLRNKCDKWRLYKINKKNPIPTWFKLRSQREDVYWPFLSHTTQTRRFKCHKI